MMLLILILTLTGCAQSRVAGEYDSSTNEYAAGFNAGSTLLTLNPNNAYSKVWYENQFGKISYAEGLLHMEDREAFNYCSEMGQTAFPDWGSDKHNQYTDYLAGCLNSLGWTEADHSLVDINSSK